MKIRWFLLIGGILLVVLAVACSGERAGQSETAEQEVVTAQQSTFQRNQPIPAFDWSLERYLVGELYKIRNGSRTTYSVIVALDGTPIFTCPSMGYGIPYNVSMTNPLQVVDRYEGDVVIEQAEPNGLFTSPSTQATWVFCLSENGDAMPIYSEPNVVSFPFPVRYDSETGMLVRMDTGDAITIDIPDR